MSSLRLRLTVIDCPHPVALATFYADLLSLEVEELEGVSPEEVTWIEILDQGVSVLAFQQIDNYVAPTWPEGAVPQQLHLDIAVTNLDEGEAWVLAHGATKDPVQPGSNFRVYRDPIGHPFCLVTHTSTEASSGPDALP
jgi:hypothetical protein